MRICVSCVLCLYVCLFFFFCLTHGWSELLKDDSVHFIRKTFPPLTQNVHHLPPVIAIAFFVNWDDVQLSGKKKKKTTVEGLVFFVSSSLSASLSPRVVWLCILPQTRWGERAKYRGQLFKQAEIFCASIQIISTRDSLPSSCSDACDCD